ncbi:hypothetical protein A4G20_05530 [Pasteurellaceae bacterium RH1A]|nr:hypothetical protein A4G20_05530 [Pasteurellaceae bacterium RH1A]
MTHLIEPNRPRNQRVYSLTVALEIALLECDELGLEAERVEFDGRLRPRIIVADNHITRRLLREGKAQCYGTDVRGGLRQHLIQMRLRDCNIIWKTEFLTH